MGSYNTNVFLRKIKKAYDVNNVIKDTKLRFEERMEELDSNWQTLVMLEEFIEQCMVSEKDVEEKEFLNNLKNEILQIDNRYKEIARMSKTVMLCLHRNSNHEFTQSQTNVIDAYLNEVTDKLKNLETLISNR